MWTTKKPQWCNGKEFALEQMIQSSNPIRCSIVILRSSTNLNNNVKRYILEKPNVNFRKRMLKNEYLSHIIIL